MSKEWIEVLPDRLEAGTIVMVTVAHVEGSAPRDAGTTFLVSSHEAWGTIGGGHLEFEAIRHARAAIALAAPVELKRYALGPSLGQCCGGVVWLLYEVILPGERGAWVQRRAQWQAGGWLSRRIRSTDKRSSWTCARGVERVQFSVQGEAWEYAQGFARSPFPIFVFGAGHVGEAITQALAPLSSDIVWIDSREDAFPPVRFPGIDTRWSDDPVQEVAAAPTNTWFLVLTHSHDLDLSLAAAILARADFAFFGLIGSKSKRARFEHRLAARGLDCSRMVCPIGIPGITGKAPATIAVAVAAQLVQSREALPSLVATEALETHG